MAAQHTHLATYLSFVTYMGVAPDITIHTVLSCLEFLHCNSVSPEVITNYVSCLKAAACRYNWDSEPLYHQLISAYLRSIAISTNFKPTPWGTFDLMTLACISRSCDIF